jgi:C1A family cysteine protease
MYMSQLQQNGMGYIPDLPTVQDYTVEDVKEELPRSLISDLNKVEDPSVLTSTVLPSRVDNRKWCSAIQAQLSLGSCTAQASVSMMEYMQKKTNNGRYQDGSRLFVYWYTRKYMGEQYIAVDSGAYNRLTMKVIAKKGIPEEVYWKHNIADFAKEPSQIAKEEAVTNRALKYFRIDSDRIYGEGYVDKIKTFLNSGYAMFTGFPAYDNIYSITRTQPVLHFPTTSNKLLGGHAVMLCGYDNEMYYNMGKGCFLAQNSWDTSYGDRGFFWIPYKFFNDALAIDTWCATDIEWVDTGVFN